MGKGRGEGGVGSSHPPIAPGCWDRGATPVGFSAFLRGGNNAAISFRRLLASTSSVLEAVGAPHMRLPAG